MDLCPIGNRINARWFTAILSELPRRPCHSIGTCKTQPGQNETLIMFGITHSVLLLGSIFALVAVVIGWRYYISADAREARRRARSHAPVVSRRRGPSVKLAFDADKSRRRRKH